MSSAADWESGKLGCSEEHAKPVSPEMEARINEALGMVTLSVRLDKEMLEGLKARATEEGLVLHAYIRHALRDAAGIQQ